MKDSFLMLWTIVVIALLCVHCVYINYRLGEAQSKIRGYELELSNCKSLLRNASYRWPKGEEKEKNK